MIRWPWVSRRTLEATAVAERLASLEQQMAECQALLAPNQASSHVPANQTYSSTSSLSFVLDEFRELINAKCGNDYRKRAMMLRQLAADRAAGVSDDDIRAAIEYGVGSSGVPE